MEPGWAAHIGAHMGPIWVPYRLLAGRLYDSISLCTLAYMCTQVCFYKPAYLYMCMYASIGLSIRLCAYMFLCMFLLVCLSVSAHICFY